MPRNKEMRLFPERGRGIQQAAQLTNLPMPKKKESKGLLYKRSKMETKPLLKRRRENSKNSWSWWESKRVRSRLEEVPLGTIISKASWKPTCFPTNLMQAKRKKKLIKPKIKRPPKLKIQNQKKRKKERQMVMQRKRLKQITSTRILESLFRICHLK